MTDATVSDSLEYDETTEVYRYCDRRDLPLSTGVVLAVCHVTDSQPTDLEPLFYAVDPELLNRVADDDRPAMEEVTFTFNDVRVTADSTGEVTLRPLDPAER